MSAGQRGIAILGLLLLSGCGSLSRVPFTQEEQAIATIPGIPAARLWADDPSGILRVRPEAVFRVRDARATEGVNVLSLSGGGADGAFGAGLLVGWSERGTRPVFAVVSGVSAGALIAPFAFLGPTYDPVLKRLFTDGAAERLLTFSGFPTLLGLSLQKGGPLKELVARHVDKAMVEAVAVEHKKGRRLLVVTTNLDAQRTVVWNMGEIASSNDPRAVELFRDVLVASASIPGVFPPVLIDVDAGGRGFAEMHVDGGVTTNVLVVPEAILLSVASPVRASIRPRLFIVINNKLTPEFDIVRGRTIPVVTRSVSTVIKASMRSTLISTYAFARRHGWEFNLVSIGADHPAATTNSFDTAYMRRLYDYGHAKGRWGPTWEKTLSETRIAERASTMSEAR